jgi:hypothetical protein
MGVTKNKDVKEAFLILTQDGNQIFLLENEEVKIKYDCEADSWSLRDLEDGVIKEGMKIAYYAVSNKYLSFSYRFQDDDKKERKEIKLEFLTGWDF